MRKKGIMRAGLAALPYSKKALQSLADVLKVHRSMVWLDPVTNRISIKQFNFHQREQIGKNDSHFG